MFDFEKLEVYQRIRAVNHDVLKFLVPFKDDDFLKDQLRRSSLSVSLNLAEGVGRFSSADKKRFLVIARSSVFECVATAQAMLDQGFLSPETYQKWYEEYEIISKMLLKMYRNVRDFSETN